MTSLDWIIVALTLAAAFAGYAQGFVVGAATLVGLRAAACSSAAASAGC